jgi:hypothetical protein
VTRGGWLAGAVLAAGAAIAGARSLAAQDTGLPPRVVPVYLVPADHAFDPQRLRLHVQAVADVRQWYARALGGVTFIADPVIVHRSRHTFAELAADDFQAWWPLLAAEFRDLGLPWDAQSDFKLLLLAQAAGGWAGGDSENGGLEAPGDAGSTSHGNLGGLVVIGDSSVAGVLAGVCPADGIVGGTIWWCNWDTYRGTIAHELGHTWGIPHPDAFLPREVDGTARRWDCGVDGNTLMQCHWGFPHDSLLAYERRHLRSLRFFVGGAGHPLVSLVEMVPDSASGSRTLRRPGTARDSASAAAWVRRTDGGMTGYPSAVTLAAGAWIRWRAPGGCGLLVTAAGRAAEAGGRGTVEVLVDDSTAVRTDVAPDGATGVALSICPHRTVTLRVAGDDRFAAVLGSPRFYPRGSGQAP